MWGITYLYYHHRGLCRWHTLEIAPKTSETQTAFGLLHPPAIAHHLALDRTDEIQERYVVSCNSTRTKDQNQPPRQIQIHTLINLLDRGAAKFQNVPQLPGSPKRATGNLTKLHTYSICTHTKTAIYLRENIFVVLRKLGGRLKEGAGHLDGSTFFVRVVGHANWLAVGGRRRVIVCESVFTDSQGRRQICHSSLAAFLTCSLADLLVENVD